MRPVAARACLCLFLVATSCTTQSGSSSGTPPQPQHIDITVTPAMLVADGVSQATVRVTTVAGRGGNVRLTTDRGSFLESGGRELTKATDGTFETTLVACLAARPECPGTGTIEGTVDGVTGSAQFTMVLPGGGSSSSMGTGSSGVSTGSSGPAGSSSGGVMPGRVHHLVVTPQLAGAGTMVTVAFRADGDVMGEPSVTVAGAPAMLQERVGGVFIFGYAVTGSETQGLAPVVVSATFSDGSSASAQGQVTFDFSAAVPPATTVVTDGRGAFVSGQFQATAALLPGGSAPNRCEVCVSTDGTCDTEWVNASAVMAGCSATSLHCVDGTVVTVNLRASMMGSTTWTYANAVTRLCDDLAPTVGAPRIDGARQGMFVGGNFRIEADVVDGTGSGPERCEVCLTRDNACDTEWVAGTVTDLGVCQGPSTTCMDGRVRLAVRAYDAVNRLATGPQETLTCDNTVPTAAGITAGPVPGVTSVPNGFTLLGQFSDVGAGISGCEVCVSRDGLCDTEWTMATQASNACSTPDVSCTDGETLTLNVRARDALLGTLVEQTALSSVCDAQPPPPPANLRAIAIDDGAIELAWDPASATDLGPVPYRVHYAPGSAPPFDGVEAAEGPSSASVRPVTVTHSLLR